jgi:hypothetical protein
MRSFLFISVSTASGLLGGAGAGAIVGVTIHQVFGRWDLFGFFTISWFLLGGDLGLQYGRLTFGDWRENHQGRQEYVLGTAMVFGLIGGVAAQAVFELPPITVACGFAYALIGAIFGWDLGTRANFGEPGRVSPAERFLLPGEDAALSPKVGTPSTMARVVGSFEPVGEESVRLWDGHIYRRSILEAEFPELARYASANGPIGDVILYDARLIAVSFARKWSVMVVVVGMIVLAVSLFDIKWPWQEAVVNTLLLVLGLEAFGCVVLVPGLLLISKAILPWTVRLQDGIVRVECPLWMREMAFGGGRWYKGKTSHSEFWPRVLPKRPAIILIFPDQGRGWFKTRGRYVCCGLTAETRERWIDFLSLASIPNDIASH